MMAAFAVALALGPMLLSGCSGRSSFLSGGPTVGQLKTGVAHLEYENAQMKRDLAKIRRENQQMESRLAEQERDNGELTARLDDARNLLRERGVDAGERPDATADGSRDPADGDGPRTLPAGQSSRKRRKPPVARIPGQFTPAAPDRGDEEEGMLGAPQGSTGSAADGDQVGLRFDDDVDHHSNYSGPLKWAPIASGASDAGGRVR